MDTDKDNASLGQNTNPDPTTSPGDVVPTASHIANNAIFSSSDLPTATPLSAPLPTDPLHPIQTVGTGRGDVVLQSDKRPGANKKLVLIIAGVLALAISLVVLAVITSSKVSRSELAVAFDQYRSLVEHGPEGYDPDDPDVGGNAPSVFNEEVDNPDPAEPEDTEIISPESPASEDVERQPYDDWFFFNVAQSKLPGEERTGYLDNVVKTFDSFLSMAKHAKSDIKTELVARVESYDEMLKIYVAVYALDSSHNKMLETLLNSGDEAAAKYIEQILPKEPKGAITKSTWGVLSNEVHSWQNILRMYIANNCVVDGEIDTECAAELYEKNNDFTQLYSQWETNYNGVMQTLKIMKSDFYNQTLEISNLLEDANEKE